MSRSYFYTDEEKLFARLLEMQRCVSEQTLHAVPCPLLVSQLNELEVFTEKLLEHTKKLKAITIKIEKQS